MERKSWLMKVVSVLFVVGAGAAALLTHLWPVLSPFGGFLIMCVCLITSALLWEEADGGRVPTGDKLD